MFVPVLQVFSPGTAVQLWPAGHAKAEETHVQRTVSLQALCVRPGQPSKGAQGETHPTTFTSHPFFFL
uniref:Uncharacterized protein n=1 Tax=Anguilla anguilla TaxID=7936 RepID=A0A0E9VJB6_ANGAN